MSDGTQTIFITGAGGEVGQGLLRRLGQTSTQARIITLDLHPLPSDFAPFVHEHFTGDLLDDALLETIAGRYRFDTIYHLAALLSTTGERQPMLAHEVNVDGTMKLMQMALAMGDVVPVKFIYPSSIAIYGLPDLATKRNMGRIAEDDYLMPTTMYGCNKLYCERVGVYYSNHYEQLTGQARRGLDFRCVRFPGLISAFTVPSGGTSDYAPEMLHAAARGEPYACFVREDATIPFMAMPDGVQALIKLAQAPREALGRDVYNIGAFSLSAGEFAQQVRRYFPDADIRFVPDVGRQGIVDTWCADVDDGAARADWGWSAEYDLERAFCDYLVPHIRARYAE